MRQSLGEILSQLRENHEYEFMNRLDQGDCRLTDADLPLAHDLHTFGLVKLGFHNEADGFYETASLTPKGRGELRERQIERNPFTWWLYRNYCGWWPGCIFSVTLFLETKGRKWCGKAQPS
jgi:hypothetical protein